MASDGPTDGWCGTFGTSIWLGVLHTISPCVYETAAAGLLSLALLMSLLAQGGRLAYVHQLHAQHRWKRGVSGQNGAFIGGSTVIDYLPRVRFEAGRQLP